METALKKTEKQNGRKSSNIEDQINVANTLLEGLSIYVEGNDGKKQLKENIKKLKDNINILNYSLV